MTIPEAEMNAYELGRTEKDRTLARHYQDLWEALNELDLEMLETFLNREEYNK